VSQGPPDKPSPAAPGGKPTRKRRRTHRARNAFLILLALLLVFHRPLLIALVHAIAIKVAATQNVRLSLDVGGSVLTDVSLRNIRAVPSGDGPTPVVDISIDELTVHYSIPGLIHNGISGFLNSYALRNATIVVKPVAGTSEQKSNLASTLHDLIQQLALLSNQIDLENVSLVAQVPDGEFAMKGLNLFLDPVLPGSLDIALLQVPKVRTWHDLHATGTYANRDLILNGLALDPQIVIRRLEIDASQRAQGINRIDVHGEVFGGTATFSLLVTELPGKHRNNVNNATAQLDSTLSSVSIERLSQYFNSPAPAIGIVSSASVHLIGDPNTPSGWTGALTTDIGSVHVAGEVMDKAGVRLDISKGWATFSSTLFSGSNAVTLQGDGKLPDSLEGFAGTAITGWLDISGADLPHFSAQLQSGRIAVDGAFDLRNNTLRANLNLKASDVSGDILDLSEAEVKAEITKSLPTAAQSGTGPQAAPFVGLQTQLDTHVTDLRAGAYAIDSADIGVTTRDALVNVENLAVRRANNVLTATGTYTMPGDMASWTTAPTNLAFSLSAPSLAAFNAEPNLTGPDGQASVAGVLINGPDGYGGKITANVTALRMQDFTAQGLTLDVSIAKSLATINTLTFALNPTDGFSATGHVGLQSPYSYDGTLQAQARDLSKFNALLSSIKPGLAGALNLNWSGKGDLSTLRSTGALQLSVTNAKVQTVQAINVAVSGTYSPDQLTFPTFNVTSSLGGVSAIIAARQDVLTVNQIALSQGGKPVLTGNVTIPLDLHTPAQPDTLIPPNGPIFADLVSSNIAIDGFFPKGQAPATGTAKATITARGSIDQPNVRVIVAGRGLQAKAAAALAPATLDADCTLLGSQLSLKARLAQPSFSPVEVAGTIPFSLKQILHNHQIDPNSPVQLSVRVPSSSLGVIPRIVPAARYVQGTAQASVDIAGTIAKPALNGSAQLDVAAVRLANPDMPSVDGFRGDLRFAGNQLTLAQFGGNLSGGRFDVTGGVTFSNLTNPLINLHFVSHGDLVMRNESVTVRTDSDIRVNGPLAAASVTGNIGITKSRFFKEIEILPLDLPGRPAPKPPAMPTTSPSITVPPLSNWKFALKIQTKDPFIIHGNLANGEALIDLNLGGTGRAPTLDGTVRIENFAASLPFSTLNITNGFVYFTKDDPFIPHLNIQASSNLQDYNINVYIYGTAQDPKTVMSSEPPLPQADIVSLLATGATAANLNSGTGLAGRAAVLLAQQLYHKIFKAKPPSDNESFASRFKVDVGGVDPRTGQQEISSSFKVSRTLYLIAEIDVGGDLRGMIRYLIRFK
jgi:hypothetical protein